MDLKPEMDSSFLCRCCSGSWSYVIGFFDFSLLNIFGTQSSEQLQKKNPTSCMFGSPFACARIFFSPRNRASKMRERHQLFFGLRLLVSKEFRHLANKNRAALWRTLKFWNPSHATVPFSKKSSPFYEMKNLFFLQIYSEFIWYVCSLKFIWHFT
jgi:hypothetical protein